MIYDKGQNDSRSSEEDVLDSILAYGKSGDKEGIVDRGHGGDMEGGFCFECEYNKRCISRSDPFEVRTAWASVGMVKNTTHSISM